MQARPQGNLEANRLGAGRGMHILENLKRGGGEGPKGEGEIGGYGKVCQLKEGEEGVKSIQKWQPGERQPKA